ncbi:uncharacterized protein LOC121772317 isoform X1 [Salvia splendens]|uniref:uncharacterized protein LOC121772317 isoform X1 n=1 Tax=Salvia splendens TaxID=180675 RepID=UPI001C25FA25|nr:uncharacterized protein LOC121772317 isoform X1 [Salvia splendens]
MASKGQRKLTYEGSPSGILYLFPYQILLYFVRSCAHSYRMSSFSGVASGGHADKVKGDRTRRSWSKREEEALLVALHDLVAGGWKSDNGFRNGYATRVYQVMKREIPDTELKVSPHINSKITMWKREYGALSTILDRSGVGFNSNNDYKIECNNEQWAQIVKADSNAKTMRNKSWPY